MEFSAEGYIQEFTRHSSDVLLNLNELRKRQILTDVCLLVDGRQLKAHKAVLMACSGFFYSVFLSPGGGDVSVLPLPDGIELRGFQALLDFMYTSRLALSADSIRSVLAAAEYLRMDHVMETCRRFIHTSYDHTGFHLAPAGTLVSTFPAPPQDREGLNLHAREVQGVLPLPPNAGMASPPTPAGFPAGSVVRSTKSWTRSLMMGLGGIRDSGCSFQKALVPPSDVGEDVVRLQAGPVLSHPAESGSLPDPSRGRPVQSMLEERSMSVVMATEGHQAGQGGPTDRNLSVLTPDSPTRSDGHPNSPTESSSCGNTARCHSGPHSSDPKAWNWKKYKFIVLNSLKQEEAEEQGKRPGSLAASVPFPPEGRGGATSGEEDSSGEEASGHHGLQLGFPARPSPLCIICDQRFQGVAQLRHHVLHGHPGEEPSEYPSNMADYRTEKGALACGACELRFQDEEELQRHFLHVHDDEKPYKCSSCMAAFRYKGNLASHRAAHSGEKPYHCGVCGAQFNRPANLKTHARIHSGEKPYKCETCGSRFVQVAHLRAHVLIHTGEKPYPCETCGTRFRHLQTLKSHIRIHTGEKPYHCETCDLHFRHKSQLRLHLRQKHGAITNTKIRYKVLSGPYAMTAASF